MNEPSPKPMRVAEWGKTSAAAPSPAPGSVPPPPPSPAPAPAPAEEPPGLPVDPLRLLGGLWQRRLWLLFGGLLGLVLGCGVGFWRSATRYEATVQLIKREITSSFRAGEIGESFKPQQLSGATLIGLATSDNVLRRVAEKSAPRIDLRLLRLSVTAKEQRGTDYVNLTISGYVDAIATVNLANLWAQEVVEFSREMQARESREMRQYLQQQIEASDLELKRVHADILEYSRSQGLISADKQIDAFLRSLGDIDLRYETSRFELAANDYKLASLLTELARQSPTAERLKAAQLELDEVRTRLTDLNPIVRDKQEKVRALEQLLAKESSEVSGDVSRFAGTFLGNTIYLQILELQNQQQALRRQIEELAKLRAAQQASLTAIPEKELGLAQLERTRQSLETSRTLISSRLREAQLFEERSPGYYRVFLPATADNVGSRGKPMKVAAYSAAGCVALAALAFALVLLLELLDPTLRTGAEAARALRAPLLAAIPRRGTAPGTAADIASRIWIRWFGPTGSGGVKLVWIPASSPQEDQFWQMLLAEARRLRPDLLVVNLTAGQPPAALSELPVGTLSGGTAPVEGPRLMSVDPSALSIDDTRRLVSAMQRHAAGGCEVWCRCDGPVREPLSSVARQTEPPLILMALQVETLAFWREQAARLQEVGSRPCGIVTLGEVEWNER